MLYLEEFTPGQRFKSREYELTEESIIEFASAYDPQFFHLNDDQAQNSLFEGLSASGWHVGAVTMRLLTECLPVATGIIGGGVDLRWLTPTRPGDRLQVDVEVAEVTASRSKPDRGTIKVLVNTRNQNQVVRQTFTTRLVVFRRGAIPKA